MRGSVLAQILVGFSVFLMITIQIIATSGGFNDLSYESELTSYESYINIPQAALIAVLYIVFSLLYIATATQLIPRFGNKEGSRWLRTVSGPVIVSAFLFWIATILACYKQLIASACIMGLNAFVTQIIIFVVFSRKTEGVPDVEKYIWQDSYAGWHVLSVYLFILTMNAALIQNGQKFATSDWWFCIWGTILFLIIVIFYSFMQQKYTPIILNVDFFVLIAFFFFERSTVVGVLAIIYSALGPLTFAIMTIVNLDKQRAD